MINLDQVRTLEWKVKQAVQLIVHLRRENDSLRSRLSDTEVRLQDLEAMLEAFKASQTEMESGIRNALEELDNLEGEEAVDRAPASEATEEIVAPQADAPTMVFEPEPEVETELTVEIETEAELTFEKEFAALAAEEAALEPTSEIAEAPASVELEPEPEEKNPEQPGLGIF